MLQNCSAHVSCSQLLHPCRFWTFDVTWILDAFLLLQRDGMAKSIQWLPYSLHVWEVMVRLSGGTWDLSPLQNMKTEPETQPAFYSGTRDIFSRKVRRSERQALNSILSSHETYLYIHYTASFMACPGTSLPLHPVIFSTSVGQTLKYKKRLAVTRKYTNKNWKKKNFVFKYSTFWDTDS